jgi:general secretion pathway protein B
MSYILDALRRAENERERERKGLPSLHSQLHEQAQAAEEGDTSSTAEGGTGGYAWKRLAWGLGLGLLLGGTALWTWSRLDAAPTSASPTVAAASASAPQPIPPAPLVVAAESAPAAPVQSLPTASAPMLAPMPAVLPDPPKKAVQPVKPERKPAQQPPIQPGQLGSSETAKPSGRDSTPPAGESRAIRSLGQLPEGVRRELPPLAVSGSMYSPQPSARMVVLDGQVAREGDELRPGLSIESIEPKSAILNYRGERFRLTF